MGREILHKFKMIDDEMNVMIYVYTGGMIRWACMICKASGESRTIDSAEDDAKLHDCPPTFANEPH